ncbi:MAG: hypothetical protein WAW17_20165 [Rhodococcus sp. (in: high G+C Gram-positive bacteria)]|uniref:hypothetical protein n=1 Tax=Rhodococcus sp. TaxID=1831 RepID=UPI003BB08BAB
MPESDTATAAHPTGRRRPRPWELAALAGLVLAVVVGLAVSLFTPTGEGADGRVGAANIEEQLRRSSAVQSLLDSWATAVRSDDAAALAALMDESASAEFLAAEIRRAGNLAGVELSDWSYEIADGPGASVPAGLAEEIGADEVWSPPVQLRYALAGADVAPTRKPVAPVVARRGETWTLIDDEVAVAGAVNTWRGPWDFGPVISRRVSTGPDGTSVVLGHPENADLVNRLADELPAAVINVTQLWGPNWPGRAVVWVAGSQDEFTALVGPDHDGGDIAAVAISDAVGNDTSAVTGQRIVFSPASSERLTDMTRRAVLRHELTHVAVRGATVDRSPMWMLEGYAEYAAYRGTGEEESRIASALAAQISGGNAPEEFPADTDFVRSGDRGSVAYETAWSINAYVAEKFGEARLTELYRALSVGEMDAETVDERLSDVLGIDSDEFRARWSGWVVAHLG